MRIDQRLTIEEIETYAGLLREWLLENGPATRRVLMENLDWPQYTIRGIIKSEPEWLVCVDVTDGGYLKFAAEGEHVLGECRLQGVQHCAQGTGPGPHRD